MTSRAAALLAGATLVMTTSVACGGADATRTPSAPPAPMTGQGHDAWPPAPSVGRHRAVLDARGRRNPELWPYPARSIWNMPLGDRARLLPAGLGHPSGPTLAVEEDILVATPNAPPRPIYFSPVGWNRYRSRCGERTTRVLVRRAPVAPGFVTDPGFVGLTPNHAGAILRPNGRLIETQPLHMCSDGSMVSLTAPPGWQGGSILTGDTGHHIHLGGHGASGLTAFGGTIRVGEWVPGGAIRHAVKIELWGTRYLSPRGNGFRWPADHADAFHRSYGGTRRYLRMGALLALPPHFKVRRLHSPAAKILARTLKRYGAYVVGNTGRDTVAFATEWGPGGRVISQFQDVWGFPLPGTAASAQGRQKRFLKAVQRVYQHLAVVADNSPRHIGGKGKRLAPLAPPLGPLPGQGTN